MIRKTIISGIVALLSVLNSFAGDSIPVKHALVVGISDYSPGSGFRHICADNDLKIITKLLQTQGFSDTIILRNSQATKEGFKKAFEKLRLRVHPGDVVFIQFSTHGQQLQDMNGDEPDGFDEAIALYDSRSSLSDGYKGENHLTDDEFGDLADQLRKDLGKNGDLLVLIDACHSGSMTRGESAQIRGGYDPLVFDSSMLKLTRGSSIADEGGGMFSRNEMHGDFSDYVMISACENNEVSTEYYYNHNYFGPLTWAFLGSMINNTDDNYTYGRLYNDISFRMTTMFMNCNSKQHPSIEQTDNTGADRIIFGGKVIPQEPYYIITSLPDPGMIGISGGMINGISDSTRVEIFPVGTTSRGKAGMPFTTGKVVKAGYLESLIKLDSSIKIQDPAGYRVFMNSKSFSSFRLKIATGKFQDAGLKKRTIEELRKLAFVVCPSDNPDYILKEKQAGSGELVLDYADTKKRCREITLSSLESSLLKIAVSDFLKNINASSQGIDIEISFLHSDTSDNNQKPNTLSHRYIFREMKDTAVLQIVNTGTKSIYFSIIDIDPENNISVFIPARGKSSAEYFLKPGQKFRVTNIFSKPYGTEIMKVIACERNFDLRPVINNAISRGESFETAGIFDDLSETRGSASGNETNEIATFSFFFDITK